VKFIPAIAKPAPVRKSVFSETLRQCGGFVHDITESPMLHPSGRIVEYWLVPRMMDYALLLTCMLLSALKLNY